MKLAFRPSKEAARGAGFNVHRDPQPGADHTQSWIAFALPDFIRLGVVAKRFPYYRKSLQTISRSNAQVPGPTQYRDIGEERAAGMLCAAGFPSEERLAGLLLQAVLPCEERSASLLLPAQPSSNPNFPHSS